MLKIYKSRYDKIRGSSAREVFFEADKVLDQYKKKRRQSFVKSKYFGAKVFLTLYKTHLRQKPLKVQVERSRFLPCAIDLIKNSKVEPLCFVRDGREYYRFYGETKSGDKFCVQIMKDKKQNRYFMSCFDVKNIPSGDAGK